jgi:5-methylcytosine-specific restriction endonuclease McrA
LLLFFIAFTHFGQKPLKLCLFSNISQQSQQLTGFSAKYVSKLRDSRFHFLKAKKLNSMQPFSLRNSATCQLCDKPAPFKNKENDPYLESHHIVWLSNGGDNIVENTIALCPNCHRKMHIVNSEEDIKKLKKRALELSNM